MSTKEISAFVMVLSAVVISGWVAWDAMGNGVAATAAEAAGKMVWAIGYSIVFNIVAVIVGVIVVSVARREEVKDERADERDRLINAKSMMAGYFVLSIGVLLVLIWQAFGLAANHAPYALFGISMLAGGAFAVSQIVQYRLS
jgi:nitrate reductase gamma subunit